MKMLLAIAAVLVLTVACGPSEAQIQELVRAEVAKIEVPQGPVGPPGPQGVPGETVEATFPDVIDVLKVRALMVLDEEGNIRATLSYGLDDSYDSYGLYLSELAAPGLVFYDKDRQPQVTLHVLRPYVYNPVDPPLAQLQFYRWGSRTFTLGQDYLNHWPCFRLYGNQILHSLRLDGDGIVVEDGIC